MEGYSGLPMSLHNKNYTDAYKSEAAERAAGYPCTKKDGFEQSITTVNETILSRIDTKNARIYL